MMSAWSKSTLLGVVLLAAVSVAASARAATAPPDTAEARIGALAERARAERKAGDFDAAIATLKEAVGIKPEPWLLYNIARLYEDSGRYDLARSHYELCVGPNVDVETQTRAKDGIARLDKFGEHGRLVLTLSPKGSTVKLDGVAWDLDDQGGTSLTSGPHQLAVSHSGYVTFERRVDIVGGQALNLVVNLSKEPTEVVRTVEVEKPVVVKQTVERTDVGAWPWVALAAGVVAGGVGTYLALDGRADQDDANSNRDLTLAQASTLYDQGTNKVTAGLAAAGVGGALLVTAIVLFIIDDPADTAPDDASVGLRAVPLSLAVTPASLSITGCVTF